MSQKVNRDWSSGQGGGVLVNTPEGPPPQNKGEAETDQPEQHLKPILTRS